MDDVLRKIIALCQMRGIKQSELAETIGLSGRSTVTNWKTGKSNSYMKYLPQIAEKLDTTASYLLGETMEMPSNIQKLPQTKKVPLLGDIACGEPILAVDNIVDFVNVPLNINADIALTCKGDSMIGARILDGDVVYIRQQDDVENGEIAAVLIGDEATLKRVYKSDSKIILSAANPNYADMVYINGDAANVHIIGKAVAFVSFVR